VTTLSPRLEDRVRKETNMDMETNLKVLLRSKEEKSCSRCGQTDLYKIDAYCMAHQKNRAGAMVDVVSDGHGHSGIASGLSSSRSQSPLVASLLPGLKKVPVKAGMILTVTALFSILLSGVAAALIGAGSDSYDDHSASATVFLLCLAGSGALIAWMHFSGHLKRRAEKSEQEAQTWEERMRMYTEGWLCVRAGTPGFRSEKDLAMRIPPCSTEAGNRRKKGEE
jgi:hypothetical protein